MPEHGLVVDFTVARLFLTALLCVSQTPRKVEIPDVNQINRSRLFIGFTQHGAKPPGIPYPDFQDPLQHL